MSPCNLRNEFFKQARDAEDASRIHESLSSPALQAPNRRWSIRNSEFTGAIVYGSHSMSSGHKFKTNCSHRLRSVPPQLRHRSGGPLHYGKQGRWLGPNPGRRLAVRDHGTAARGNEHPPTASMNKAAGNEATSSQDAQRQTQGMPTAAQEAQGAKVATGNDC